MCSYEKILRPYRRIKSTYTGRSNLEEYYSDHSRILFSSSFRRLQQKAQVFSLEPNASVRTRLTHSLEVADNGRTLASKIAEKLVENGELSSTLSSSFISIVENACLLHDIGNPPFGHFGEAAIKKWFMDSDFPNSVNLNYIEWSKIAVLLKDFKNFDGNPQGLRISLRLHCERDEYGLNLTVPTLLSCIKYPISPDVSDKDKNGYFISEKQIIKQLYTECGLSLKSRYPLSYIMEAADDISYFLSDVSDGIEKGIITADEFINDFIEEWKKQYPNTDIPVETPSKVKYFNLDVSVKWSKAISSEVIDNYILNHDRIIKGEPVDLINMNGMGRVLKVSKNVCRKNLYRSPEAENIELSGYKIITGLLTHFGKLLELNLDQFSALINGDENIKGLDLELRLLNRIALRFKKSYQYQLNEFKTYMQNEFITEYGLNEIEWWLRTHLVLDHISGMTDDFALETYQMLEGIRINS